MTKDERKAPNYTKIITYVLIAGGFLGLLASFVLTLEKITLLKDPVHQLSCSINPILSCGPIIGSDQASLFGFPNPIIGIASYAVLITVGMGLLAGAKYKKWFWLGLQLGATLGMTMVIWLIYQSLYTINALCIYCMVAWTATWPIFWYTSLYNLNNKNINILGAKALGFLNRHHVDILISWYLLVITLILIQFWDYWSTLI